jgi:hypothetical protein
MKQIAAPSGNPAVTGSDFILFQGSGLPFSSRISPSTMIWPTEKVFAEYFPG